MPDGESYEDIVVKGRTYRIRLVKMTLSPMPSYYCAYVDLSDIDALISGHSFGETFREGNTFGVDTAHMYNDKMSLEEKRQDAIRQIRGVIEEAIEK
jgi:hypothetical protein